MSRVDVSQLLVDPDFVDSITLLTRIPLVDGHGENRLKDIPRESVGCVQPADFKTVKKLPEALQIENVMSFWFKGVITVNGPKRYPIVLIFRGVRYQVQTVADWSTWGAGWSEGTCVAEGLA